MRLRLTTPINLYYKTTTYVAGQMGATSVWMPYTTTVGGTQTALYWADWVGSFGKADVEAASIGVYDLCTLRMVFQPELYNLLRAREVIVIKNATAAAVVSGKPAPSHPDVYTVWGAIDNAQEQGQVMEFKVKRWEAK